MEKSKANSNWIHYYKLTKKYMETYKRRPSKHRTEDHQMLNWIKYNKRKFSLGEMSEERQKLFSELMVIADKYRKVNQFVYSPDSSEGMRPVLNLTAGKRSKKTRKRRV